MYINNKKEAIQFIKDFANGSIYYTYEYELNHFLSKQQIERLMKKYNTFFTTKL